MEQILKTAGMSKAQAVMIGDSDVDIQTGKNAGVHTIGCVWGFRGEQELERAGADDLARTPADLLRFMTKNAFVFSHISGKIEICLTIRSFFDIMFFGAKQMLSE